MTPNDQQIRDSFNAIVQSATSAATDTILSKSSNSLPDALRPYFLLEVIHYLTGAAEVAVCEIADIPRKVLESDPDLQRDLTLYSNLLLRHYGPARCWADAFQHATLDFEATYGRACMIGQRIISLHKTQERNSK